MTDEISIPTSPTCTLACRPEPTAATSARVVLREALTLWELTDLIDTAALVATELVSNAIRSNDVITVQLHITEQGGHRYADIEVFDTSPELPKQKDADPFEEDGRGLFLVSACSTDWGYRPLPDGKIVWARIGPSTAEITPVPIA